MATVIILPKQGQSVESCIITEIKKKKGDTVAKGDILFSYETDKASFEEESPVDGVVLECFYNDGDEVPVLLDMMVIGQPGEKATLTSQTDSPPTPHRGDLEVQQSDKKEVQMPNNVVLTPLKGAGGCLPALKILLQPKLSTLRNWPVRGQMVV